MEAQFAQGLAHGRWQASSRHGAKDRAAAKSLARVILLRLKEAIAILGTRDSVAKTPTVVPVVGQRSASMEAIVADGRREAPSSRAHAAVNDCNNNDAVALGMRHTRSTRV